MNRAALLLVDLQNDYLRSPSLLPSAGSIISGAASALAFCRKRGIPVAHCRTGVRRDHDERMPHWKRDERWDCVIGTAGYESPSPVVEVEGEMIFHKTFYSPFEDAGLEHWLSKHRITTVLLAGVHLHACIRAAALDAYASGYEVIVIDDAVGSDDPLHAAATRRYLRSRVARFTSTDALPAILEKPGPLRSTEGMIVETTASRHASASWRQEPLDARIDLTRRIAAAVRAGAEDLAQCMARELYKPITAARAEALSVSRSLNSMTHHARAVYEDSDASVRFQPHGVIAILTPWNNPVAISLGKILPALLYGNSVVWKPSPAARDTSRMLFSLLEGAGTPAGLISMLEGDSETGEHLMAEGDIDAVTITGSEQTGRAAQDLCGRRMLPLQAELGGNNAAIVWDDCDLDHAAAEIARGAFGFAGQRCTANRRVIVSHAIEDAFLERFIRASSELPWGQASDPRTVIGPVISHQSRRRLETLLERAADEGLTSHRLHAGRPAGDEPWICPAVVIARDSGSEIVQEESFGPIAVVQTAESWEDALDLCNGVRQGLVAALFSASSARQSDFLGRAEAGILKINSTTADADVELPFGGWKSSGIGPPEHGASDREFYTRVQAVYQAQNERG